MLVPPIAERVAATLSRLRQLSVGNTLRVAGCTFHKVQQDRNHIFRVADEQGAEWFLKIIDHPDVSAIRREVFGWSAYRNLPSSPQWLAPGITYADPQERFLLLSRLPGYRLNRFLYAMSALGIPVAWRNVRRAFESLGMLLAALHETQTAAAELRTDRCVASAILQRSPRILDMQWREPFEAAARRALSDAGPQGVVHGNLSLANVVCHRGRAGLMDFENCGRGRIYSDVGRVLQHLLCMELATGLWSPVVRQAARGLFAGYASRGPVDTPRLGLWLYLHMVDFYQMRYLIGNYSRRVGLVVMNQPRFESALRAGPDYFAEWAARCAG